MAECKFEISSTLAASPEEVWAHCRTMEGVNWELSPWLQMSVPASVRGKSLSDISVGSEAFRSVLLFAGFVPFDVHHLTLERVLRRGFDEASWSILQRRWRHERRIEPNEQGGCEVIDRLEVEPRLAPALMVEPLVRNLFRWRHRRLAQRFGDTVAVT